MWIVFIYYCQKNSPQIGLFKEGDIFSPFVLNNVRAGDFFEAKKVFGQKTGIYKEDCFPDRFFDYAKDIKFILNGKKQEIWTTSVRILRERRNHIFSKNPNIEWFPKEDVIRKINHNKKFLKAFRKEFTKDMFWECLDTRKRQKCATPIIRIAN